MRWLKFLTKSSVGAIFFVSGLVAGILCLDFLSSTRPGSSPSGPSTDSRSRMIDKYARRVSTYSLVGLDVLRFEDFGSAANPNEGDGSPDKNPNRFGWKVHRDSLFYSCIGDVRRSYGDQFIDISALTISIVALENYNRQFFRRAMEGYAQDIMHALSVGADYTIGPAQVKTSLAAETYRAHVSKTATDQEINAFARSNCGSVYLASLLIESYLAECSRDAPPSTNFDETVKCVAIRYTGLKEGSRLLAIYTRSAILSYNRLFDLTSGFYDRQFAARLGISQMESGECIQFNPRRGQLRIFAGSAKTDAPPPSGESDPEAQKQTDQKGEDVTLVIDTDTIVKFKRSNQKAAIVKVIPTAQDIARAAEREELIKKYVCERYQPPSVDFYPVFSFLPTSIRQNCQGDEGLKSDAYIVLVLTAGKNGEGGGRVEACPTANKSPAPASPKLPTKQKR